MARVEDKEAVEQALERLKDSATELADYRRERTKAVAERESASLS
jgi:hypothetical protein